MLDRSQPHQQVFGLPGVAWSQGGRSFDPSGHPVTYHRESSGQLDEAGTQIDRLVVERIADEPVIAAQPSGDELESYHWKHLSVMLGQYGETYTTKEAAIAFLRGRRGG